MSSYCCGKVAWEVYNAIGLSMSDMVLGIMNAVGIEGYADIGGGFNLLYELTAECRV